MNLTLKTFAIASLAAAFSSVAHATVIADSALVDIEAGSNIFRDFRGDSSTRGSGDKLVFSIKVSDASSTENEPRDDTLVLVKQVENGGDPTAETGNNFLIPEFFGPAIPNEYAGSVTWDDNYLDTAWKIVALPDYSTDPTPDKEVVLTVDNTISSVLDGSPLPLSTDITLNGDGDLNWIIPETDVFYNQYRVSVIRESDRKQVSSGGRLPIDWDSGSEKMLSLNIFDDLILATPSLTFEEGEAYELRIETTHFDANRSISKQINRSSTFANFTLLPDGTDPIYLPTLDPDGNFNFDFAVVEGETYGIDPFVAIGYDYAIGEGDPLFASVMIPNDFTIDGIDVYQLLVGGDTFDLAPNVQFFFAGDGVTSFRLLGIDPALMLDPSDTTAFVTNLTFAGDGRFTGTMTPITEFVPEPASVALLSLGLAGIGYRRRKKMKAA